MSAPAEMPTNDFLAENHTHILEEMKQLALGAGEAIQHTIDGGDVSVTKKPDGSAYTDADDVSKAFFCNTVQDFAALFPTEGPEFLAITEETVGKTGGVGKDDPIETGKYYLIVDELDNSKQVEKHLNNEPADSVAVLMGLLDTEGKPVLGVAYNPLTQEMLTGDMLAEPPVAMRHQYSKEGVLQESTRITLDNHDVPSTLHMVIGNGDMNGNQHNQAKQRFMPQGLQAEYQVQNGMYDKLDMVLRGDAHAMPRYAQDKSGGISGRASIWDVAGPMAILQAAGGTVHILGQDAFTGMEGWTAGGNVPGYMYSSPAMELGMKRQFARNVGEGYNNMAQLQAAMAQERHCPHK